MGLFMNFTSFMPMYYKFGLIKTLIDRVYKICSDRMTFNLDIKRVKEYLCKNAYPHPHLFDKQLKEYIDKKQNENAQDENKNVVLPEITFYWNLFKVCPK